MLRACPVFASLTALLIVTTNDGIDNDNNHNNTVDQNILLQAIGRTSLTPVALLIVKLCCRPLYWHNKPHPYYSVSDDTAAGHWQNKPYPYAPYQDLTLGDGILTGLDMSNEYWWVWLGVGVNLAYVFLMNVMIVICLAYLPGVLCSATLCSATLLKCCAMLCCAQVLCCAVLKCSAQVLCCAVLRSATSVFFAACCFCTLGTPVSVY